MKPATPGFLVTLVATILLAVVSFSVPYFKSVFFLKASLAVEGVSGSITFGVLGYCLELSNGTTCSKPSIGYELDINQLVGDRTRIQIPQVIVKWITYALVLHIVALAFATVSTVFGLLAHVREYSMTCLSTCVSGVGAAVTLLAFVFDLALFFLAKSRLNAVQGGSATMGNAIWLTLTAWILLFFSGCFYGLGRCCVRRRPRNMAPSDGGRWVPAPSIGPTYEEQMRLDAVKAEADRNARKKQSELGLPSFPEYDPTQPLTADVEHDPQPQAPYRDSRYAAAPVGTRAVDEYYAAGNNAYPPRRQPTTSSARTHQTGYPHSQQTSGYASSNYAASAVLPTGPSGFLNADNIGHEQYPSQAGVRYGQGQYPNDTIYRSSSNDYGQSLYQASKLTDHRSDNATPPRTGPDNSGSDPFQAYANPQTVNPSAYNSTARFSPPVSSSTHPMPYTSPVTEPTASYFAPHVQPTSPPSRSYTLGGGGYGDNAVPALHDRRMSVASSAPLPYPGEALTPSSGSAYTAVGVESPTSRQTASERMLSPVEYDDSPPRYDDGTGMETSHPTAVASRKQ
ncbi:pali-domain-containing protein [Russula earlei]|uniref:Pali-domain-containing protein n=1 Tax=Russula earlei TaxID=71964 RepID=A0ACC0U7Y1_9AGAM|nr:pali-domain-containing protein [Russula earlei]